MERKKVELCSFEKKLVLGQSIFVLDLKDVFQIKNSVPGSVQIAKMDGGFIKLLEQSGHLTERSDPIIVKFKLNKPSKDPSILSSLRNKSGFGALCNLTDIARILILQPDEKTNNSHLQNNKFLNTSGSGQGTPHMFYVEDKEGNIVVVRLRWRTLNKAWHIDTWSFDDLQLWSSNRYFYFRKKL